MTTTSAHDETSAYVLALTSDDTTEEELPSLFADVDALSAEELARLLEDDGDAEAADVPTTTTATAANVIAAAGSLVVGSGKRKLAGRRNSNKARDGRKAELAYLRKSVAELETRLEMLRSSSSVAGRAIGAIGAAAAAAESALSPSLDARTYYLQEMVPRDLATDAQCGSRSRDAALWREIARRQSDERYRSERENVRLKLVLENQLKVAQSLEKFLQLKATASTTEISKSIDVRRQGAHTTLPPASLERSHSESSQTTESEEEIYQVVLSGVEQMIAEIDAVFEAKGLARALKSGVNAQLRIDPDSGMTLEICATKELPFGVHETGAVVWNHYQFAKQRMPHRYYSYNAHKSVDATDDTIIEDFILELHAKNTRARFRTRQMMRRAISEDRYVIVWWSFFDPFELSEEHVSGIRFLERGYITIRKSPSPTHASTLLQLCLVITPYSAEGDMGDTVGAVTDFMLSSTAANIAAAHQMIENVLLEQALRNNGAGGTSTTSEASADDSELLSIW